MFWLRGGDKNSRYFHVNVKSRRARKSLDKLMDGKGDFYKTEVAKRQIAVDYFSELFKSSNPCSFVNFFQGFQPKVSNQMNVEITKMVTKEEVRDTVFSVKAGSALGPDGMSALFFQHY